MQITEFIEKLAEAIEIEDVAALNSDTIFKDLEEWSSLSVMLIIAFFDEEFDKLIEEKDIHSAVTINDLYQIATA
ncbi:MAG: acyl carrier protein [Prevotella sp.]|nr:acyl carrier protein [Prevotella sp.]